MLSDIRQIMNKYDIPPEMVGTMECMACDIYDFVDKKLRRKYIGEIKTDMITEFEVNTVKTEVVGGHRADTRNYEALKAIHNAEIGDEIFVPNDAYHGNAPFAAYVHPAVKLHSKIKTRRVEEGWIITKIGINKK